jgi:4-diphosphocytidyl-2-C-methyl-D-erythritol kinase
MTAFDAPAKINLYLHVLGRRDDGFHLLDSLIVFAGVGDRIEAEASHGLHLETDGPHGAALGGAEDNLVIRAARALAAAAGIDANARLKLAKNLPVSSGIGGGSADAAAALHVLDRLWHLGLSKAKLQEIARGLGADVPVCLNGWPSFVGGIGERVDAAPPLPDCWLVLANPGTAVSTPAVFGARTGPFSRPERFSEAPASAAALAAALAGRRNDLTDAAIGLAPEIADVLASLERLPGCLLSRMSGSGATCFALFGDWEDAATGAALLSEDHPGWWIEAAPVLPAKWVRDRVAGPWDSA